MDLTARTLILDVLSTLRNGAMPVRALVEAGDLFGFANNNIRVSLSKLYAEGRVARDVRGRYRLSQETEALSLELRRWRRLEQSHEDWKGDWIAIHCPRLGRGSQRRRRERAFEVLGFRALSSGLYLRPDNLSGGIDGARTRFFAIAGEAGESLMVAGLRGLDPRADLRARSLWDSDHLTRHYHACLGELKASRERLPRMSEGEAMVESFLVGAGVVRKLIVDPLLPEAILDPGPRRALVEATRTYDELGRSCWAPFLDRHGVLPGSSEAGWRATHGPLPIASAKGVEA